MGGRKALWLATAAVPVLLFVLAGFLWSLDHPYGIYWDEATYMNEALIDNQRLEHGMVAKLAGRIVVKSWGRPPAYRILALPFVAVLGPHTTSMRVLSLTCFGLSSCFIYLATRRIASHVAAALAVLVFVASPEVISASIWFGTEGPLYVATSAMLYYIVRSWTDKEEHAGNWIGLGLAVGLGFLSKASFLVIAVPALGFWLIMQGRRQFGLPCRVSKWKAGLLAAAVAGPWWMLNLKTLATSVQSARGFVANSLGHPGLNTWMNWSRTVFECLLGPGICILILVLVVTWIRKSIPRKEVGFTALERVVLGLCACAGIPIVLAQLSGTNHLLRHISPALIPLSISLGIFSDRIGWNCSKVKVASSIALCGAQFLLVVFPAFVPNTQAVAGGFVNTRLPWRVMSRRDQWDWNGLQELAHNRGLELPKIAFMGFGPGLTPPHLEYPWCVQSTSRRANNPSLPEVTWLWRFEEGAVSWEKVMEAATANDMVLTLPNYTGVEVEDGLNNQHNSEFLKRLCKDPRWEGPVRIEVGRFGPVEVDVFFRKDLHAVAGLSQMVPDHAGQKGDPK